MDPTSQCANKRVSNYAGKHFSEYASKHATKHECQAANLPHGRRRPSRRRKPKPPLPPLRPALHHLLALPTSCSCLSLQVTNRVVRRSWVFMAGSNPKRLQSLQYPFFTLKKVLAGGGVVGVCFF